MFICQLCYHESSTLFRFAQHMKSHRNAPNSEFRRGVPDCPRVCPCILLLLMAHFKEKSKSLLLEADVAATAADVQRTVALPDSPRLIVQGDKMNPNKWMLSVESEIVLWSSSDTFVEGLAALFAIYYTFNLEYQEGAASTLEFFQRGIVGINPGTGSKVGAGKRDKKQSGMNPHVYSAQEIDGL